MDESPVITAETVSPVAATDTAPLMRSRSLTESPVYKQSIAPSSGDPNEEFLTCQR
jgi:hypothetical protein